ncbi:5'-nucleotidase domain-containing protein [Sarcoptes scabiei]|uniref:5'-nucleotidase domain-containing protein n=1 Tax=Sarcoptes scabiei TaxID=52283 RepID=A0A132AH67_SARSC|nr:5'-nucleotidase domain-containing protein [Sarcoptes scabiei]
MEGTVLGLLKMTGWNSMRVIYFGDQIYSDLADITLNFGWRTGAIIAELEKEIETHNSAEFKEAVSALQALQQLVDEGHENNVDKSILSQLIQQRDALRVFFLSTDDDLLLKFCPIGSKPKLYSILSSAAYSEHIIIQHIFLVVCFDILIFICRM